MRSTGNTSRPRFSGGFLRCGTRYMHRDGRVEETGSMVLALIKRAANYRVTEAVASNVLSRPSQCETCKKPCRPDGHHDDYSEPLRVRWLCRSCHQRHHVDLRVAGLDPDMPGVNRRGSTPDQGDLADAAYEDYRERRDTFRLPEYDTREEKRGEK